MATHNNGTHFPLPLLPDPEWQQVVKRAGEAIYQQPRYRPTLNHGKDLALEHAFIDYPEGTDRCHR